MLPLLQQFCPFVRLSHRAASRNGGAENAGVEISARNIEKMKEMKMQKWKHRHGPAGDENAEVEISGVGLRG